MAWHLSLIETWTKWLLTVFIDQDYFRYGIAQQTPLRLVLNSEQMTFNELGCGFHDSRTALDLNKMTLGFGSRSLC